MLAVRSTAAPMMIGAFAELLPAAVAAATVRPTAAATSPSAATIPSLGFFIVPPQKVNRPAPPYARRVRTFNVVGLAFERAPLDLRVHDARGELRRGPRGLPGRRCRGDRNLRAEARGRCGRATPREWAPRNALRAGGAVDPASAAHGWAGRAGPARGGVV